MEEPPPPSGSFDQGWSTPPSTSPPTPPAGEPPGPGPPEPPPIPWEQPGLDFFTAFYESLRLLVGSPRRAFERVRVGSAIGRPLAFAILVGWPGILAATLWDLALKETTASYMPWATGPGWGREPVIEIGFALLAPLWLPIAIFLWSALQHLFLLMVGGARHGFTGTFRVLCYAQVSTLLGMIPACGSVIGGVWNLVLAVIGYSAVHRISTGRALFAVLMPLLLCCGCAAVLFSIFGAAWLAAFNARP